MGIKKLTLSKIAPKFFDLWVLVLMVFLLSAELLTAFFGYSHLGTIFLLSFGLSAVLLLWFNNIYTFIGGTILTCITMCALFYRPNAELQPITHLIKWISDFSLWLYKAHPAYSMTQHPRFGEALVLLFVLATALVGVIFIHTLRRPLLCAATVTVVFTVVSKIPYLPPQASKRPLFSLICVLACCGWFYLRKKYRAGLFPEGSFRLKAVTCGILTVAFLLTAVMAGFSKLDYQSAKLQSRINGLSAQVATDPISAVVQLFKSPITAPRYASLGGNASQSAAKAFELTVIGADGASCELPRSVYLRTGVFDKYNGNRWECTTGGDIFCQCTDGINTRRIMGLPLSADYNTFDYTLDGFTRDIGVVPAPLYTSRISELLATMSISGVSLVLPDDVLSAAQISGRFALPVTAGDMPIGVVDGTKNPAVYNFLNVLANTPDSMYAMESRTANINSLKNQRESDLSGYLISLGKTDILEYLKPYLAVPEGLPQRLLDFSASPLGTIENGQFVPMENQLNPMQTAESILNILKNNYRYTKTPKRAGGDFVDGFLFETREGYCTSFASAMTVLCRIAGLPARYVEGYCASLDASGHAVIKDSDLHAWTEVYFHGFGWFTFDATAPDRGALEPESPPVTIAPTEPAAKPDPAPEAPKPEAPEPTVPTLPEADESDLQGENGGAPNANAENEAASKKSYAFIAPLLRAVAVISALALVIWLAILCFKKRKRYMLATVKGYRCENTADTLAIYAEILRMSRIAGLAKTPCQTPRQHMATLDGALDLEAAAAAAECAIYSGKAPKPSDFGALLALRDDMYAKLSKKYGSALGVLLWRNGYKLWNKIKH